MSPWLPEILTDDCWQMSPGERAALQGILAELSPRIAIEIGVAQGGSLRRISARTGHVHAFDLVAAPSGIAALDNVTFHIGDSHELLAEQLGRFTEQDVNVDFVLIDGDHSALGVRRDVEDLLGSPAVSRTLILVHDTANPEVRAGLDAIAFTDWPTLTWVDLDWVPGFVFREGPSRGEAWGGLGILVVDADQGGPVEVASYAYPATEVRR